MKLSWKTFHLQQAIVMKQNKLIKNGFHTVKVDRLEDGHQSMNTL